MTREQLYKDKDYSDHVIVATRFLRKNAFRVDPDSSEGRENLDRAIDELFSGDVDAFVEASYEFGS